MWKELTVVIDEVTKRAMYWARIILYVILMFAIAFSLLLLSSSLKK